MSDVFDSLNEQDLDDTVIKRVRAAYDNQVKNAADAQRQLEEATKERDALLANQRASEIRSILAELKAPGVDPGLFPADAPVNKDAVQAFLKDKIGLMPTEDMSAWSRYEQVSGNTEPPAPPQDENEVWAAKEMAATSKFYKGQFQPSPEEAKAMDEAKDKVFGRLLQWDEQVSEGRMDPIIRPEGFGGLLDPPSYARRARHHISQAG